MGNKKKLTGEQKAAAKKAARRAQQRAAAKAASRRRQWPTLDDEPRSVSVRTVSGGGFETNRRKH